MATDGTNSNPGQLDLPHEEQGVGLLIEMSAAATGEHASDIHRGLELAAKFFGLEFGIVSRVEGDRYVIDHVFQSNEVGLVVGQEFELGLTYCAITLEASDVVSIAEMKSSMYSGHPCYDSFQLESYLGVPLHVDGEVYGTLNFSSTDPMQREWTETDRQLVRVVARWVESSIQQNRLRSRLSETLAALDGANTKLRERNEDLDNFARHASHDLQAPLQNVVSLVGLLTDDLGDDLHEEASEYVSLIETQVERMGDIVQALLAFSQTGRVRVSDKAVALEECVDRAIDALHEFTSERDAEISRSILPNVRGESALLTQVFQNLIGNAVKFQKPGHRPRVEISGEAADGVVRIQVADNGIGFDAKYADAIFAPLARLHGAGTYQGNGLGLAICRKIVNRHGGTIEVSSVPGSGSTFTITLDAATSDQEGE